MDFIVKIFNQNLWLNLVLMIILVALVGRMLYLGWKTKRIATTLSPEEFRAQMKSGQLIDVRDRDSFQAKHIMGARNFPLNTLKDSMSGLRKDRSIFVYDQRKDRAGLVVRQLHKAGFRNLYILKGGFDQWDGKVKKPK